MLKTLATVAAVSIGFTVPAAAQDYDPTGTWEWEVSADGQAFYGSFELTQVDGAWTGSFTSDQGGADLTSVELDGNVMTMMLDAQGQGEVLLELVFEGDEFTGTGSFGGMFFDITGRRTTD